MLTKRKVDKQAVTKYLFDHPYGLTREEIEKLTEHLPRTLNNINSVIDIVTYLIC